MQSQRAEDDGAVNQVYSKKDKKRRKKRASSLRDCDSNFSVFNVKALIPEDKQPCHLLYTYSPNSQHGSQP
jgi:hypothetical protein